MPITEPASLAPPAPPASLDAPPVDAPPALEAPPVAGVSPNPPEDESAPPEFGENVPPDPNANVPPLEELLPPIELSLEPHAPMPITTPPVKTVSNAREAQVSMVNGTLITYARPSGRTLRLVGRGRRRLPSQDHSGIRKASRVVRHTASPQTSAGEITVP
jgi:hypothetical protein